MVKKNKDAIKTVEKVLADQTKALGEVLECMKKPNGVGFVDEEDVNEDDDVVSVDKVLFLKDTSWVDKMTVDTACPQSMTGRNTLEKYLEANNTPKEESSRN
jgi:peptide subunit release factor 1 (eRF1)